MDIQLNANDIKLAAHYADVFQQNKIRLQTNGIVKNHKVSNETDFGVMYIGLLGEIAVGKVLGIAMRTDVTVGGDGALDMVYNNCSLQIKTTSFGFTSGNLRYLIFNRLTDFVADLAILCAVKNAYTIQLLGFTSRQHFLDNQIGRDFGYGLKFCMAENQLIAIDRLQNTIGSDSTEEII